jgi:acetamidase/formamidase
VTALECPMRASLRFTLEKRTIPVLREQYGLSREDAYVLCSLAGDLKILEIVDAGIWNVGFTMPLFGSMGAKGGNG